MEWDFNTPWYRPTRVCLVTSGSEFGWRNGAGKYPPYYPDNLAAGRRTSAPARRPASASATARSSPRSIRTRSSSATGATASSTRCTSRPERQRLQGGARGVRHRHAAAADRRGRQPRRRRDVLHHRRAEDQDRPVSRDLCGERRPIEQPTADATRRWTCRGPPARRGCELEKSPQDGRPAAVDAALEGT